MSGVLLDDLIEALRCLPGVGPKSAQRMAFHLLQRDRRGGHTLSAVLSQAMDRVGHCERCRMYTEGALCRVCDSSRRDGSQICVVETPADRSSIESATGYQGQYFLLLGHLSPLDGVGPDDLGMPILEQRLTTESIEEMIVATNPTIEGEATAHYLSRLATRHGIRATRIAHGVPVGGELEYIDRNTLAHAFNGRLIIDNE